MTSHRSAADVTHTPRRPATVTDSTRTAPGAAHGPARVNTRTAPAAAHGAAGLFVSTRVRGEGGKFPFDCYFAWGA